MQLERIYAILTSLDGRSARLAWTSPDSGITYCSICFGSTIERRIGSYCRKCLARVTSTFERTASLAEVNRAWSVAFRMAEYGCQCGNIGKATERAPIPVSDLGM